MALGDTHTARVRPVADQGLSGAHAPVVPVRGVLSVVVVVVRTVVTRLPAAPGPALMGWRRSAQGLRA